MKPKNLLKDWADMYKNEPECIPAVRDGLAN
jgi:hypothetical protein